MKYSQMRCVINTHKFTSVGSYPLFSIRKDGGALCPECVSDNLRLIEKCTLEKSDKQWEIIGSEINWEDKDLHCDNCYSKIESAYGDNES